MNSFNCIISIVISDEANITSLTSTVLVYEGEDANFVCEANGNPITEDMITWKRDDFDMSSRTKMTYIEGKSYLTIYNVSSKDVGEFQCIANNKLGKESIVSAYLLIRSKYFSIAQFNWVIYFLENMLSNVCIIAD